MKLKFDKTELKYEEPNVVEFTKGAALHVLFEFRGNKEGYFTSNKLEKVADKLKVKFEEILDLLIGDKNDNSD